MLLLGAHNLSAVEDNRIAYTSTEYVLHEDWDSYWLRNDIALIKLPEAVTLNSYINTVQLASGSNTYSGETSRVLGWGVTTLGRLTIVICMFFLTFNQLFNRGFLPNLKFGEN